MPALLLPARLPPPPLGANAIRPPFSFTPGRPPVSLPGSNNILPFRPPANSPQPLPPGGLPPVPGRPLIPDPLLSQFDPNQPVVNLLFPLFGPPVFAPGESLFHPAQDDPTFYHPPGIIDHRPPPPDIFALGTTGVILGSYQPHVFKPPLYGKYVFFTPPLKTPLILNAATELLQITRPFDGYVPQPYNIDWYPYSGYADSYGNDTFKVLPDSIGFPTGVQYFALTNPPLSNSGTPAPTAPPPERTPNLPPAIPDLRPPTYPTFPGENPEILPLKRRPIPATPVTPTHQSRQAPPVVHQAHQSRQAPQAPQHHHQQPHPRIHLTPQFHQSHHHHRSIHVKIPACNRLTLRSISPMSLQRSSGFSVATPNTIQFLIMRLSQSPKIV